MLVFNNMNIHLGLVTLFHLGHHDHLVRPLDVVHERRLGPGGTCLRLCGGTKVIIEALQQSVSRVTLSAAPPRVHLTLVIVVLQEDLSQDVSFVTLPVAPPHVAQTRSVDVVHYIIFYVKLVKTGLF